MSTPPSERTFSFLDFAALWGSLGATLYVMPFGSLLVPALSIERAILAAVVAASIGAAVVAAVSVLAARTGASSVELLADLFGPGTARPVALLLLARNVAFAALALALIGDAAELVSERALGAGLRPIWIALFGLAGGSLVLAGPEFVVRKLLRRAGFWLVILVAAAVTLSAYMEFEVPAYLRRPAVGGWPSFWQAVDVMIIVPLLWLPVVADYGRFARSPRSAGLGSFAGLFVATAWFSVLGIIYLPAVDAGDVSGFVVGMKLGMGALIVLLLLQADDVVANLYPAREALRSLRLPGLDRLSIAVPAIAALLVALTWHLTQLESTVLLVGSAFVPLFGALLGAHLLSNRRAPAVVPVLAWATGFVAYQWISPPGGWWYEAMRWVFSDQLGTAFPLTSEATWLGAVIPAFVLSFAVQLTGTGLAWLSAPPQAVPARS